MKNRLREAKLYGIIDLGYVTESELAVKTCALIKGGADIIQLRAKNQPLEKIRNWALQILPLCKEQDVPFIINDYPEIAKETKADGIHIGQEDGTLTGVRAIVGPEMIVGRSTHSLEQAEAALKEGFDYIGFGPLYTTPTKKGRAAIGLENISSVEKTVGAHIPVFCIGGIKKENLDQVKNAGGTRVVLVSELLVPSDTKSVTASIKSLL